jgi:hypothetical protein
MSWAVFIAPLRHLQKRASTHGALQPSSSAPGCAAFPPVDGRTATNQAGGELDVRSVAELPELLRRTAVLEDDLVNLEGIELTGTKAVDSLPYTLDKFSQLGLVILRNGLACGSPLGLAGHTSEATDPAAAGRCLDDHGVVAADPRAVRAQRHDSAVD